MTRQPLLLIAVAMLLSPKMLAQQVATWNSSSAICVNRTNSSYIAGTWHCSQSNVDWPAFRTFNVGSVDFGGPITETGCHAGNGVVNNTDHTDTPNCFCIIVRSNAQTIVMNPQCTGTQDITFPITYGPLCSF